MYSVASTPLHHQFIEPFPNFDRHGRSTRCTHIAFYNIKAVQHGAPGERGLIVATAQEMGIDDGGKERILQQKSPSRNTRKDEQFGISNNAHRVVIVSCSKSEMSLRMRQKPLAFDPILNAPYKWMRIRSGSLSWRLGGWPQELLQNV